MKRIVLKRILKFTIFIVVLIIALSYVFSSKSKSSLSNISQLIRNSLFASKHYALWQGYASEDQASFTMLFPKDKQVSYFLVKPSGKESEVFPIGQLEKPYSDWKTEHLVITDLNPQYHYKLRVKDSLSKKVLFQKNFKTLKLDKESLTVAVASCMDDKWDINIQTQMWKDVLSFKPDMIFLIGDNVYADKNISSTDMKNFFRRYVEAFNTLHLYKADSLIPILAVWDDHDYGFNNGHKDFIYKNDMQELFRGFYPLHVDNQYLFKGHGVSFLLKTPTQNFFFMDDQSFRSPPDKMKGLYWGEEQERWLLDEMALSKKPSWIINGGQIFGRHHSYESFEMDFPVNFDRFMKKIGQTPAPVFFLSGDRHLAEMLKVNILPYTTYELTTSGIHAKVHPQRGDKVLDARHMHQVTQKHNYAIIKSQASIQNLSLDIQVYGQEKSLLFSEKLSISRK